MQDEFRLLFRKQRGDCPTIGEKIPARLVAIKIKSIVVSDDAKFKSLELNSCAPSAQRDVPA